VLYYPYQTDGLARYVKQKAWAWILKKHNIRKIHISGRKTAKMLRSAKDSCKLRSQAYIGFPENAEKCI
jgi:hypothetical protein